mmetsp:Transcript_544/g.1539  ORF Transcript_544/g.1539 Transcript_544/m.1539 type:complete len:168 (-) Transcript_544:40-543(-)
MEFFDLVSSEEVVPAFDEGAHHDGPFPLRPSSRHELDGRRRSVHWQRCIADEEPQQQRTLTSCMSRRPVTLDYAMRWKTQTALSQAQTVYYLSHISGLKPIMRKLQKTREIVQELKHVRFLKHDNSDGRRCPTKWRRNTRPWVCATCRASDSKAEGTDGDGGGGRDR